MTNGSALADEILEADLRACATVSDAPPPVGPSISQYRYGMSHGAVAERVAQVSQLYKL